MDCCESVGVADSSDGIRWSDLLPSTSGFESSITTRIMSDRRPQTIAGRGVDMVSRDANSCKLCLHHIIERIPASNTILQRLRSFSSFSFFSCIIPIQSTRAISRSAPRAKQRISSSREVGSISNKVCVVCLCTSGLADAQYSLKPLVRSTQAPKSP